MEKYFNFDRNKSLQELDGEEWSEHKFNSNLVIRCHELRKNIKIFVKDLVEFHKYTIYIIHNIYSMFTSTI